MVATRVAALGFEVALTMVMPPCETRVTDLPVIEFTQSPQPGAKVAKVPEVWIRKSPPVLLCETVSAALLLFRVTPDDALAKRVPAET